jgi:site-specific DNA recombinase
MRAVGVIRVSRTKGAGIVSPSEQRDRIKDACERDGMELVSIFEELDVSGGAVLEKRPGLSRAVSMVEAREANTIVVAYFDRLVRSLAVQAEIVSRVEEAGGRILAVDVGQVTNGSSAQWLSGNVLGLVAEYQRRTTAERTEEAKRRAIADGIPVFDRVPLGYRRPPGTDGKRFSRVPLELDPEAAPTVREAWRMRADGAPIEQCRRYLREHAIEVSYSALTGMFRSRIYVGELHFGQLENLHAHEPLVSPALFGRVQKVVVPRGRKPKSSRLLARLGVLRCGTCGARMVVGTARANGRDYPMYRCPPNGDCPRRVTISAAIVEEAVVEAVQGLLEDVHGSASPDDGIAEAESELADVEEKLDAAVRAFSGLEDVQSTRERLLELRDARDAAQSRLDDLQAATVPSVTVRAGDWNLLTLEERRALVRAVVERVTIAPGRGPDRITVEPRS